MTALSGAGRSVVDKPCPHASALTVRAGYARQGQHSGVTRTANPRRPATLQSQREARSAIAFLTRSAKCRVHIKSED